MQFFEKVKDSVVQSSSKTKGGLAVLAVLTVVGVAAWIYQLFVGLGVTDMNNATSWGLYIAMFMFFVGLSAGSMIVASAAHVFNIEWLKAITLPALICALVGICAGGISILLDIGGLPRIWRMIVGANFASPLLWDMCGITLFIVVNIIFLVFLVQGKQVHKIACVALPVAVLVLCVDAWIFGLQAARAWYSAIMAPIFIASALDSGLSLILIALAIMQRAKIYHIAQETSKKLAGLLATFIAVDAFLIGCEILTMAYPGGEEAVALSHMTIGATAPFFWFEIICGLLVPFLILVFAKNREKTSLVVCAGALVIAGVFCKRIWLLLTSFITPNIEGALGITLGTQNAAVGGVASMWSVEGFYFPTPIELLIFIGVTSLAILALTILMKVFVSDAANK